MTRRVAIIGAGPSGLAQLHAFEQARAAGADVPELVCFEKQSDWGGLWNYTWRSGLDEHGDPCHGSMYRYLWSNGPKECLEFADYTFEEHFGRPIPSFPPRAVLEDYILGRAKKSGVRRHIRFDTAVRWVDHDPQSDTFRLTVEDLEQGVSRDEEFDHVIVATGHFSIPNVPSYPGFEQFPGRILHSHDFRDSQEFTGKDILVVGSSYSAEDIALQTRKYGAKSVTISYRSAAMGFPWPEGIDEVPGIDRVEGRTVTFVDGTTRDVDAIILCTGYRHHFPFVATPLRLVTANVLYPPDLYKGIFWTANPKMMYLSMQDQYYTFTMFDAEAWYARDVVLGRITLPGRAEMDADIAAWRAREAALDGPMDDIDFQADHIADLLAAVDYPAFDLDLTREQFKTWEHHKTESIVGYRDRAFSSPCTGTPAPIHHTAWWEALDDSLPTFLDQRETTSAS
ncbi:trimethylamine monooxygenase [Pseudonocardia ammonioxydans]|uniref:Trimethylamine monooxygenase n=1 Tax=Pseudonocardia ammonioxydans TaxID=260086 RepID=A0A1I5IEG0_PSUAM|nr:NAD(P)/FAD-dependent oxidoreductase [Pseudonocardia ammonioxydans]SFO58937.1 trimethylamine monooxygenase [Pseudonocardia ammonioxydans]